MSAMKTNYNDLITHCYSFDCNFFNKSKSQSLNSSIAVYRCLQKYNR